MKKQTKQARLPLPPDVVDVDEFRNLLGDKDNPFPSLSHFRQKDKDDMMYMGFTPENLLSSSGNDDSRVLQLLNVMHDESLTHVLISEDSLYLSKSYATMFKAKTGISDITRHEIAILKGFKSYLAHHMDYAKEQFASKKMSLDEFTRYIEFAARIQAVHLAYDIEVMLEVMNWIESKFPSLIDHYVDKLLSAKLSPKEYQDVHTKYRNFMLTQLKEILKDPDAVIKEQKERRQQQKKTSTQPQPPKKKKSPPNNKQNSSSSSKKKQPESEHESGSESESESGSEDEDDEPSHISETPPVPTSPKKQGDDDDDDDDDSDEEDSDQESDQD